MTKVEIRKALGQIVDGVDNALLAARNRNKYLEGNVVADTGFAPHLDAIGNQVDLLHAVIEDLPLPEPEKEEDGENYGKFQEGDGIEKIAVPATEGGGVISQEGEPSTGFAEVAARNGDGSALLANETKDAGTVADPGESSEETEVPEEGAAKKSGKKVAASK